LKKKEPISDEEFKQTKFKTCCHISIGNFCIEFHFLFLIIYSGKIGGGEGLYATSLMWCPGISALLTMKILKRNISELGWKWGKQNTQYGVT